MSVETLLIAGAVFGVIVGLAFRKRSFGPTLNGAG